MPKFIHKSFSHKDQKQSKEPRACPICFNPYNENRQEVIICLNQHFICKPCALAISKKDSKCPFCKIFFDINQVQPRRSYQDIKNSDSYKTTKLTPCPQKHTNGIFTQIDAYCNDCGERRNAFWTCKTCNFLCCGWCFGKSQLTHKDVCQKQIWSFDQLKIGCNRCNNYWGNNSWGNKGNNSPEIYFGGAICSNCSMRLCTRCFKQKNTVNK